MKSKSTPFAALCVPLILASGLALCRAGDNAASTSSAVAAPAPRQYRRVVTSTPALTEIAYALGGQDRVVGIARFSDYPSEAAKEKPQVGGILDVDAERILALRPDLVVTPPGAMANEKFTRIGVPVEFIPNKTLADIAASFEEMGRVLGRREKGMEMAASFREAVAAARARNKGRARVRTLVVIGYEPMWVAGRWGFLNEILDAAGGENVAGEDRDFYQMDFESVVASRPDVIVSLSLENATDAASRRKVADFWKPYASIPAVKNARIEFMSSDSLTIPGPRLVKGLSELERLLHPRAGM